MTVSSTFLFCIHDKFRKITTHESNYSKVKIVYDRNNLSKAVGTKKKPNTRTNYLKKQKCKKKTGSASNLKFRDLFQVFTRLPTVNF